MLFSFFLAWITTQYSYRLKQQWLCLRWDASPNHASTWDFNIQHGRLSHLEDDFQKGRKKHSCFDFVHLYAVKKWLNFDDWQISLKATFFEFLSVWLDRNIHCPPLQVPCCHYLFIFAFSFFPAFDRKADCELTINNAFPLLELSKKIDCRHALWLFDATLHSCRAKKKEIKKNARVKHNTTADLETARNKREQNKSTWTGMSSHSTKSQ